MEAALKRQKKNKTKNKKRRRQSYFGFPMQPFSILETSTGVTT